MKIHTKRFIYILVNETHVETFPKKEIQEDRIMKKKLLALMLASTCVVSLIAGCGGSKGDSEGSSAGKVYYLNFKP